MCDRLRASFIESSFFGSRRFQAGLSYLPPLSVKPLRVAPAKPGVYLWELVFFNNLRSDKGCQNDNLSPRSPTMFFPFSHCSPSKRPPPPVLLEQRKTLFAKVSADHSRYKLPPAFRIAAPPPLWFETRIARWWCLPAEAHDYAASSSGSNSPESVAACSTAIPASTIDLNDRARA